MSTIIMVAELTQRIVNEIKLSTVGLRLSQHSVNVLRGLTSTLEVYDMQMRPLLINYATWTSCYSD